MKHQRNPIKIRNGMITGTTRERLEYAEYVRETAIYVEDVFLPLRNVYEVLSRFYRIQSSRRELSPFEIAVANFASLTAYCSTHIGSLVYIWLVNEGLPYAIKNCKPLEPNSIVPLHEISELFLHYPKTVLEATLLKSKIPYGLLSDGIAAYKERNADAITSILSQADICSIWPSYMLLKIIDDISTSIKNTNRLNIKGTALMIEGHLQDIVNSKESNLEVDTEEHSIYLADLDMYKVVRALERLADKIESEDSTACRVLIGMSIVISRWLHGAFKLVLGESDPIVETMYDVISNEYFIGIEKMYEGYLTDERIAEYLTRLKEILPLPKERSVSEPEILNEVAEATETTLMRFFNDVLVFDGHKQTEFVNKYLSHLAEYFSTIDNSIALYSFATLFYPVVLKRGPDNKDKVTAATRLSGGIQWRNHPDEKTVVGLITALRPDQFNMINPSKPESVRPGKRIDYLVKLVCNKPGQYFWIKDFIEEYWPQVAQKEFADKLKIRK